MKLPPYLPFSQHEALFKPLHLSSKMQTIHSWTDEDKAEFLHDNLCLSATLSTHYNICKEGYAYLVQGIFYCLHEPSYTSIPWAGDIKTCIEQIPSHAIKHEIDFSWSCPGNCLDYLPK